MYVCIFVKFHWGHAYTFILPILVLTFVNASHRRIDTIYIGMAQTWIQLHTDRAILNPVSQSPYPLFNMHIHCTQRKDSLRHIITRTRIYVYDICMLICTYICNNANRASVETPPDTTERLEKRLSTSSFAFRITEKKMEAAITNSLS